MRGDLVFTKFRRLIQIPNPKRELFQKWRLSSTEKLELQLSPADTSCFYGWSFCVFVCHVSFRSMFTILVPSKLESVQHKLKPLPCLIFSSRLRAHKLLT